MKKAIFFIFLVLGSIAFYQGFGQELKVFRTDEYKFGYKNARGEIVIPAMYETAQEFSEGLASVRPEFHGYINTQNEMVIAPIYINGLPFSEGLAAVQNEYGDWGFINDKGETVIDFQFDVVGSFSEGVAVFGVGEGFNVKYGFINKEGQIVIEPQYDLARGFSEGLAAVNRGGEYEGDWGFINFKGELIIPMDFHGVETDFKDGKAKINQNGDYFFIDRFGNKQPN